MPDSEDNCANAANPDHADRDGDGVGDVCDAFPDNPNKTTKAENLNKPPKPNKPPK